MFCSGLPTRCNRAAFVEHILSYSGLKSKKKVKKKKLCKLTFFIDFLDLFYYIMQFMGKKLRTHANLKSKIVPTIYNAQGVSLLAATVINEAVEDYRGCQFSPRSNRFQPKAVRPDRKRSAKCFLFGNVKVFGDDTVFEFCCDLCGWNPEVIRAQAKVDYGALQTKCKNAD